MRRQIEAFTDLGICSVDHGSFNGTHRRGTVPHIEYRRGTSPNDRRTRFGQLMDGDPAEALGGVLYDGSEKRYRGSCTSKRHGNEFSWNMGPCQLDQVVPTEFAPNQRW